MTVLVLQHVDQEGPGRIATALAAAGHQIVVLRPDAGDSVPPVPGDYSGVVVLGGPMGLADADDLPFLRAEQLLVAECVLAGVPVLGVCLGAQLLAAALGSAIRTGGEWELGWHPVHLAAAAEQDQLFADLPAAIPALHWHRDRFDLPPGAVGLASSATTGVQAFRFGKSAYGLLFHLEADDGQVSAMAAAFPGDVIAAGKSPEQLHDPQRQHAATQIASHVFGAWAGLVDNRDARPL
ncbi:MAG: type 1 glutamine amidotransferase [Actinomycetia bacterium]|nr:type 1 glutamine amidotransferase [Actinomycetes bacterium]MCH9800961.1 type 1 glutamine amidotransferase [Actinomycetes bacterium]